MSNSLLGGKVAIVTGVTRVDGIGNAIVQKLTAAGATIFTTYFRSYDQEMPWGVSLEEPEQILHNLRTKDIEAQEVEIDLAEPHAPAYIFETAIDFFGHVDILVNNAAHSVDVDIFTLSSEVLAAHLAVNVQGTILMCQQFVRHWARNEGGRIINLTSGQGYRPMPGNLAYAASKGAIDAFTSSMSAEVMKQGITVNAVDPGPTDTGWMSDELRAQLKSLSPTGRVGRPEDAARLITFLASPDAAWITGQTIHSRGGL